MKKRIITDNLDWVGNCSFGKYKIIIKNGNKWIPDGASVNVGISDKCVKLHPDWFEDVEEEKYKVEFSFLSKFIRGKITAYEANCLKSNKSINKKQVKLIEDALNSELYSELYTEEDLFDCVFYILTKNFNLIDATSVKYYIEKWKEKKRKEKKLKTK